MKTRLNQAKLQRHSVLLQAVIAAVHDARIRYRDCQGLRPGKLSGLSRFVKELLSLPASTDYTPFERQLKRRLVRAQHRLHGLKFEDRNNAQFSLAAKLPVVYQDAVRAYDESAKGLLKVLSDVNIQENHERQQSVKELLARQSKKD